MDSTRFLDFSNVRQFLKHLKWVYIVHRFHCGIFIHSSYHSSYFTLHSMLWVSFLPPTALSVFKLHIFSYLLFHVAQLRLLFHVYSIFAWICVSACLWEHAEMGMWVTVEDQGPRWVHSLNALHSFTESRALLSRAGCWRKTAVLHASGIPSPPPKLCVYSWVLGIRTLMHPLMWKGFIY